MHSTVNDLSCKSPHAHGVPRSGESPHARGVPRLGELPREDEILCNPSFDPLDLDDKVACILVLRGVFEELARHDILDLLRIGELSVSGSGLRCSYGFSGSCSNDRADHRMRLAQVPDEVFEWVALQMALLRFGAAGRLRG